MDTDTVRDTGTATLMVTDNGRIVRLSNPSFRRAVIVALTLAIAIATARAAAVSVLSAVSPQAALQLDRASAAALVTNSEQALMRSEGAFDRKAVAAAARQALNSEPLSATALRQLGLAVDVTGDRSRAVQLMLLANRVSRRDLGAQVWLIEDRVRANDVAGALTYYDVALSTNDKAVNLFYPVLSSALDDPEIRTAFRPYLSANRPWVPGFLNYAIAMSENPQSIAALFHAQGRLPDDPRYRALETELLIHLLAKQRYREARRYALSLSAIDAGVLDDAGLSSATSDPRLAGLGWQFIANADVTARISDNILQVSVEPNVRPVAATRTFVLPPGTYTFKQTATRLPDLSPAQARWQIWCLPLMPGGNPLWEKSVVVGATLELQATIDIPSRCVGQQLTLLVAGSDSQTLSGAQFRSVGLRPAAGQGQGKSR